MKKPQLILASQSLQRAELLRQVVADFTVVPATVDEAAIDDKDHGQRARLVAVAKAEKIAADMPEASILAADTFGLFAGRRFEKPPTTQAAVEMLSTLSGQQFDVFTGVCWYHHGSYDSGAVKSVVTFRSLSPQTIQQYVTGRPVTTWAAGFSVKDVAGMSLLAEVSGSMTCVLGLPLEWIEPRLLAAGFITDLG